MLAECTGHTAYSDFGTLAGTLDLVEFDLDYATAAPYDKSLGLYLIAKAAIALNFTGSPYDTSFDWLDSFRYYGDGYRFHSSLI